MTTIALHSDLHLELQRLPTGWLSTIPDVLILAGDILYIDRVEHLLIELTDRHSELQIIYITGNYEYYGCQDMLAAEDALKATLDAYDRIHFLQCDTVELFNIRFIGCTGWPRMLSLGKEKQQQASCVVGQSINDFYQIGMGEKIFTTDDCIELGEQHYKWLEQILSAPTPCKHTVVITHFAPSLNVANPKYPIDEMSAYFYSSFDDLIEKYQPNVWAFGHTHANFDIQMGLTNVISNQHGYGKECLDSYLVSGVLTI
jgi:predicted phosphodiesterase